MKSTSIGVDGVDGRDSGRDGDSRRSVGADTAPRRSATARAGAPPAPPFTAGWQDGFVVQSSNGDYRLVLGLTAQADGRFSVDDPLPITNTFTIRKDAPDALRTGREVFRLQGHAGFRQRHGGDPRCVLRHPLFAEVPRADRQGQDAGRLRAPAGRSRFCCFRNERSRRASCRTATSGYRCRAISPAPVLRRRNLQRRAGRRQLGRSTSTTTAERISPAASSGSRSVRRERRPAR